MNKPVTIYTTQTCGFCRATKELFHTHGVTYTEIDVGTDQNQARAMIEKSGQMGVPVTVIGEGEGEEVIVGYDRGRLTKSLGINV